MKFHNQRKGIIKLIRKERVVTTSEIASYLGISWNTAERYLLELVLEGKLVRLKKKGVNMWLLK